MLAEESGCDPRNLFDGKMFSQQSHRQDLYKDVEVDYRGNQVTAEAFTRILQGSAELCRACQAKLRCRASLAWNTGEQEAPIWAKQYGACEWPWSSVYCLIWSQVYLSGHGGDGFFKFQASSELSFQLTQSHNHSTLG